MLSFDVLWFLIAVSVHVAVAQRHLGFRDPFEPLSKMKIKARAFQKSLEDISKLQQETFNGDIYSQMLNANQNQQKPVLHFVDPVSGRIKAFEHNPIQRQDMVAPYYGLESTSLSDLSTFPAQSSSNDDDSQSDNAPVFNSPQDNSYMHDTKFFDAFKSRRQNQFIRATIVPKIPTQTKVKAFPLNTYWDDMIMYLLQNWESTK